MSSSTVSVTIDGQTLQVGEGTSILEAARENGIDIPTLCYLRGVNDIGSCRLCVVEVEGCDNLVAACNTAAEEGMVVTTASQRIVDARRMALGLLLNHHGLDTTNHCFSCRKNGKCELQARCYEYEVEEPLMPVQLDQQPLEEGNPYLLYDPNLCIACQRCVGACNVHSGDRALRAAKKGLATAILMPFGEDWDVALCQDCRECAAACPTGALTSTEN